MQQVDRFQGAYHHLEFIDLSLFVEADYVYPVDRNPVDITGKLQHRVGRSHDFLYVVEILVQHLHRAGKVKRGKRLAPLRCMYNRGKKDAILSEDVIQRLGIALFDHLVPAFQGVHWRRSSRACQAR